MIPLSKERFWRFFCCPHLPLNLPSVRDRDPPLTKTRPGGESKISPLWGYLKTPPASSPEPLLTLLRAKTKSNVTRPQVTLRLSGGGPYKSFVVTAVSRAKIRGAPAAVSNVKSSNVTLKPAEGGAGALSNKRGPVVLCS